MYESSRAVIAPRRSFGRALEVRIGSEPGGGIKCATLIMNDGSIVGATCRGSGDWITVTAPSNFGIAEVQACAKSETSKLLSLPLLSAVDASVGVFEVRGVHATQLLPTLNPLLASGRDAGWRMPAGASNVRGESMLILTAAAAGVTFLGLLVCCLCSHGANRKPKGKKFARVSSSDRGGDEKQDSDGSRDSEEEEDREKEEAGEEEDEEDEEDAEDSDDEKRTLRIRTNTSNRSHAS